MLKFKICQKLKKNKNKFNFDNTVSEDLKPNLYSNTFLPGKDSVMRCLALNNRYLHGKRTSVIEDPF